MSTHRLTPWVIWLIPMSFCAFQFVLRVFPGNVQTELMTEYHIDATAFGLFSAAYYFGYAGLQIPMAIFMEKYGPRLIITLSALLCALGCWLMVNTTPSWEMAIVSRFMIGVGSVVGFLGTTKVIVDWFPHQNHTKMIGISMSIGLLGALYGGKPINLLVAQSNWQSVLSGLGIAAAVIALLAFILVRSPHKILQERKAAHSGSLVSWFVQLLPLLKNKTFILLAMANFLMVGSVEGFADSWGVNYLALGAGIAKSEASLLTSFIFLGMLIGAPLLSFIADKTQAHFKLASLCGLFMAVCVGILLMRPDWFSLWGLKALMLGIGFLSGYQALVFVIGEGLAPKHLNNISIATLNCINMFGGSFFHFTIGTVMDIRSQGQIDALGLPLYKLQTYSVGLAVIPIMALLGGLILFSVKNKNKNKK